MLGRIFAGPALRDREAIDLADMLLEAPADVESAPRLDLTHHRQHISAGDAVKVELAKGRKRILLQPGQDRRPARPAYWRATRDRRPRRL